MRKPVFLLGVGLVLWMTEVGATDYQGCQAIVDDARRLNCFDRVQREISGRSERADLRDEWIVKNQKSKIDDSPIVHLLNVSLGAHGCGRGESRQHAILMISCRENTTDLIVKTGCFHGHSSAQVNKMTLRIDDHPAFSKKASASSDRSAMGVWGGRSSIPIVKKLVKSKKLVVRLSAYKGAPFDLEFKTDGLAKRVGSLRKACNW